MSVTGYHPASIADREQLLGQIGRLIGSHVLHGSESLCKLLRYLAEHALHHPGVPLKEYQIATEVFGRPADFDPQSDSTIRVQAGRLRMKLAEYYSSEGADDPIIVEVPKGTYVLSFHQRAHALAREFRPEMAPEAQPKVPRATIALSVLLAAALSVNGNMFGTRQKNQFRGAAAIAKPPAGILTLSGGLFSTSADALLVFCHCAFVC